MSPVAPATTGRRATERFQCTGYGICEESFSTTEDLASHTTARHSKSSKSTVLLLRGSRGFTFPSRSPRLYEPINVLKKNMPDAQLHVNAEKAFQPQSDTSASATSKAHETLPSEVQASIHWLSANLALDRLRLLDLDVRRLMYNHGIGPSEYVLLAGFDRSLIIDGIGYMQQIHLFTVVDVSRIQPLALKLGKLFSPLSSMIFTPSTQLRLPVMKMDGTEWPFDEFVAHYFKSIFSSSPTALEIDEARSVVHFINEYPKDGGASVHNHSRKPRSEKKSEKGKRKGKDDSNRGWRSGKARSNGEDENDDQPPGEGNGGDDSGEGSGHRDGPQKPVVSDSDAAHRITFHVQAKIHCNDIRYVQTINSSGSLSVQMTKQTAEFRKYDIDFTGITHCSQHTPNTVSFDQDYLQITVDSRRDNGQLEYTRPLRTAGPAEIKKSSSSKSTTNLDASFNASFHPSAGFRISRSSEKGKSEERMESISKIHHGKRLGLLWWGYSLNDRLARNAGLEMLEGNPHLPFVKLQYRFPPLDAGASEEVVEDASQVADTRKISRDAPIDVEFASFWNLVPSSISSSALSSSSSPSSSKLKNIIQSFKEQRPSYSNMVQCIVLTIPPLVHTDSDYIAEVNVNNIAPVTQGRAAGSGAGIKDDGPAAVAETSKRVVQRFGEVKFRTNTIPACDEREAKTNVNHNMLRPTMLNLEEPDASRRGLPSKTSIQFEVSIPPGQKKGILAWLKVKKLRKRFLSGKSVPSPSVPDPGQDVGSKLGKVGVRTTDILDSNLNSRIATVPG
ncbi:hypothetical protein CPC08DRAFT_712741 [Agrocybe pediades]|nr:hypothetical protein CPC08DRAFT_712741 [Agrocybe pediades]